MIDDLDVERPGDLFEAPGNQHILFARSRVAAWMVVNKDETRRIMLEGAAEYRPRVDRHLAQAAILQSLVRYQSPGTVEEKHPQRFVGKRPHRRDQIASQFRTERVDCDTAKIARHGLKRGIARADYQRNDRRNVPEDAAKRFGRCRPDPADALELLKKLRGYPLAICRFDGSDEPRQDGSLPFRLSRS